MDDIKSEALELLRKAYGKNAEFRPGQLEAITAIVSQRQRLLVVQRTGWGKSVVYFIATKLLRQLGYGPTILISPLLSLIRNQVKNANETLALRSYTINSSNRKDWVDAQIALAKNQCDILLISPERLANQNFRNEILAKHLVQVSLFVVDEAHCISDWGHDFRPDYRRIVRILQSLPKGTPILATTATANNRVVEDIKTQLGKELIISRGPLARESLRLFRLKKATYPERLTWLADTLPKLAGSGIVYTLTVEDANRVAEWLNKRNISAAAYYGDAEGREVLEEQLLNNEVKVLVATVALGMGFDKPDLGFVIHFQKPGSIIGYYQQVGRAGRELKSAYAVLMVGHEDEDIHDYFIRTAFPPVALMNEICHLLTQPNSQALTQNEIVSRVNYRNSEVESALKILEVEQAITQEGKTYVRSFNNWVPDEERIRAVTTQRRHEFERMQAYLKHDGCLMAFLQNELDDPTAKACGRCENCIGKEMALSTSDETLKAAKDFMQQLNFIIEPRAKWPSKAFADAILVQNSKIPAENRMQLGRVLCMYHDQTWGQLIQSGKYQNKYFSDDLVEAMVALYEKWQPQPAPQWVTAIPSNNYPKLVPDFAGRLATRLNLPFHVVLYRKPFAKQQKTLKNSEFQAKNVWESLEVQGQILKTPVLLIDDMVDSSWTFTVAAYKLLKSGSGPVYPFALAKAAKTN